MQKNVAGQKWSVFAFNRTTLEPVTGDAANITAKLSKDGAAAGALTDTNPAELEDGYYVFDVSQTESNADILLLLPESSTSDVQVIGSPSTIFTVPENFADAPLATAAELAKVPKSDSNVTWNATALGSIQSEATDALNAYDPPTNAEMEARTLPAADYFDPASDTVANVTTVGSVTTKTGFKLASDGLDLTQLHLDWLNNGRLDLLLDSAIAKWSTAMPEITSVSDIPADATPIQALTLCYMWLRNNTQDTATARKIVNNAGTVVLQGTMADDGTTFSQGKLGTP